jgi:LysM repeat protein
VAAVVLPAIVLAGAAYLASPMIVDWVRQMGVGGPAASPSPSTAPLTSSAQASSTPAPTGTPSPEPTPRITPKPTQSPTSLTHVVVKGETLTGIAARYGVTVAAIEEANAITDVSLIYVGEQLVIPSH